MDIEPGTVVASRYRITRPLGRGGMGEVFAAENIRTGRPVAVKLLRAEAKQKLSAIERFRREARAAGSINSDHVTEILDVEDDPDKGICLVFELLEGESLIERLKRTGPIPFDELFSIIEQTWVGLADAHKAGVVHRDLKPSNVFLERRPDGTIRVKILDFGISKLPKEMGGETLTEMGQSLGTFSFMPPEQIGKAKTVDHRADIYAATTMIYQSLTAQLPYLAKNILNLVELKAKSEPRTLAEAMRERVDPRLEAFVAKGLARNPDMRFQSALEALQVWRELRPSSGVPSSQEPRVSQYGNAIAHGPSYDGMARSGEVPMARSGEVPMARSGAMPARPMPVVPVLSDPSSGEEPVIRRLDRQVPVVQETTSDGDAATIAMPLSKIGGGELANDPRVKREWSPPTPAPPAGSARLNKTVPMQQRAFPSAPDGMPRREESGMYPLSQVSPSTPLPQSSPYGMPQSRGGPLAGTARLDTQPSPQQSSHLQNPQQNPQLGTGGHDRTQIYRPTATGQQQQPSQMISRAAALSMQAPEPAKRVRALPLVLGALIFAVVGFLGVAVLLEYIATGKIGLP